MTEKPTFPQHRTSPKQLEDELQDLMLDEVRGHWSRSFRGPPDVQAVAEEAFNLFGSDNGLFSMRAEYLARIETEVTGMCAALFNSPEGGAGTLTSGGSESIFCALHAMREWARDHKPQATAPEVVMPYSAHPAFSKACHYLGLKVVRTPLGEDLRASPEQMAAAITPNTIGLVGSAPCWPYGLYDPIESLGALAEQNDLWLHVDACVGGYLAPFLERLGHRLPLWDFRVGAVKSISADLHKFGYCPKPASTVLWRSEDLLQYHYVHPSDWPGGMYSMRGFAGSRSAGPIFAAWAVLRYLGSDGYTKLAAQLWQKRRKLMDGINRIPGLHAWENDLLPIAFESRQVDLGLIKADLSRRGWILVGSAEPPLVNIPLDVATTDAIIEQFLDELAQAVELAGVSTMQAEKLEY